MNKRIVMLFSLIIVALFSFSVINAGSLSGTLQIAGSTTVLPLAEEIAQRFMEMHPDVKIFVQGGGSSAGIKAAMNGTADIGNASRELRPGENLVKHVVAKDGIAIVVNPANKVENLTMEQVQKIFAGEIKSWKDLGVSLGLFANSRLIVINREAGSGTRGTFEELVMEPAEKEITTDCLVQASNGAVLETVGSTKQAIAYLSLGYVNDKVKAVSVDGVAPTVENVKNGSYKISRNLYMLTKGEPTGLTKAFLDYATSDAVMDIVAKCGYMSAN